MQTQLPRRTFLKISALAAALPLTGRINSYGQAAAKPLGEDTSGLTTYELGPQIWIRLDNRPLTCYRAHRSQKYPYMYPLSGPASGLSLTDETTLPYPHHRSLFFGCDKVNGGNYWQEGYETGQIFSKGPKLGKSTKEIVEINDACDWQKPTGPLVMQDKRKITIQVPSASLRFIDWDIEWIAVQDITIPKTNHSLFSMRAALDITPKSGGNLMNANGDTGEKGTFEKKATWCGFHGKRMTSAGEKVEGIAIMDDPKNPWGLSPWFTRDYGFASPTPLYFEDKPFQLVAGKSIKFRYRVVLHTGDPKQAGLDAIHKDWSSKA